MPPAFPWIMILGILPFPAISSAQRDSLLSRAGAQTTLPTAGRHSTPSLSNPVAGNCLAVWETAISTQPDSSDITGRLISVSDIANNRMSGTPFVVCAQPGSQSRPAVTATSSGFLAVWEDNRNAEPGKTQRDIYCSLIASFGTVTSPVGIPLSSDLSDESDVEVCMTALGGLVVWEHASSRQIRGIRLKPDGRPLDATAFIIAESTEGYSALEPCVATDGERFFVAWEREHYRNSTLRIAGRVISGYGVEQASSPVWEIGTTKADEAECVAACIGGHACVSWAGDESDDESATIVLRRFPLDGAPPTDIPVIVARGVRTKEYQMIKSGMEVVDLVTTRDAHDYAKPAWVIDRILELTTITYGKFLEVSRPAAITSHPAKPGHMAITGTYPRLYLWEDARWEGYETSVGRQIYARCRYPSDADAGNSPAGILPQAGIPVSTTTAAGSTTQHVVGNGMNLAWIQPRGPEEASVIVAGDAQGNTAILDMIGPTDGQPAGRLPARLLSSADGPAGALTASVGFSGLLVQSMAPTSAYQVSTAALSWLDLSDLSEPQGVALAQNSKGAALLRTMMTYPILPPKCAVSIVTSRQSGTQGYERVAEDIPLSPLPAAGDRVAPLLAGGLDGFCAIVYPRNAAPGAPEPVWCQVVGNPYVGYLSPNQWHVATLMESSTAPYIFANGDGFLLLTPNPEDHPGPAWRATEISGSGLPGTSTQTPFARDALIHKTEDGFVVFEPSIPRMVRYNRFFVPVSSWRLTNGEAIHEVAIAGWKNGITTFTAIGGNTADGYYPAYFGWREPEISALRVFPARREVDFHFPSGLTLEIESSADLVIWTGLTRGTAVPLWNPQNDGLMTLRDVAPAGERLFYRLRSPHLERASP